MLKAPVLTPGSVFQYNNAGPYLLGILIQRKAGCSLEEYLRPRLFEPLGITLRPVVEKDPLGNTFGAGGLQLNVTEFSKLGLFISEPRSLERKTVNLFRMGKGCFLPLHQGNGGRCRNWRYVWVSVLDNAGRHVPGRWEVWTILHRYSLQKSGDCCYIHADSG